MKHTPGPWKLTLETDKQMPSGMYQGVVKKCTVEIPAGRPRINLGYRVEYTARWAGGKDGPYLPYEGSNGDSAERFEENLANARAIAAVPDMIAALDFAQQEIWNLISAGALANTEIVARLNNIINDALVKARGAL